MPRYFFHVRDGIDFPDHEGTELESNEAARQEAVRAAGRMLAEGDGKFWGGKPWTMRVVTDSGIQVRQLEFSARTEIWNGE